MKQIHTGIIEKKTYVKTFLMMIHFNPKDLQLAPRVLVKPFLMHLIFKGSNILPRSRKHLVSQIRESSFESLLQIVTHSCACCPKRKIHPIYHQI